MQRNLPYFYGIYDNPNADFFRRQCAAIERRFPNIRKDEVLEDVDGSSYQIYYHSEGMIRVCNDYCLGDLYVESEFDLLPYFKEDTQ